MKNEIKLELEHLSKKYDKLKTFTLDLNEKHEMLKDEMEAAKIAHR